MYDTSVRRTYLEWDNLYVHGGEESERSVGPRDDVEKVGVLVVFGARLDRAVGRDDLKTGADVLPEAVLVRCGLDHTAHNQAAHGQVAYIESLDRKDGMDGTSVTFRINNFLVKL